MPAAPKRNLLEGIILEKKRKYLPDKEGDEILKADYRDRIAHGMDPAHAKKRVSILAEYMKKGFQDPRFGCSNRSHLKYIIRMIFSDLIRALGPGTDFESMEKLNHLGRIVGILWFDVEGLKSTNDLFGSTVGDQLLQLMASKIMPERNPRVKEFLARYNLRHFTTTAGGDEFVLIIQLPNMLGAQTIDQYWDGQEYINLLKELRLIIQRDISELELVFELGLDLKALGEKIDYPIPADFHWSAAAPAGSTTFSLSEFLEYYREPEKNKQILFRVMDAVIRTADSRTKINKNKYKKDLRNSDNEINNIVYMLITRNEEELRMYKENKELRQEIERLTQR